MDEEGCDRRTGGHLASDERKRGPDRRRVLKTTAGGVAGLSLAGCLETAGSMIGSDDVDPVTIGVLAPDPDSSSTGRSIVQGARIAVDEINESGGILGREVEMAVGDTNASPTEGRRQYQRLILQEGADVTVGISTSEVLVPLMEDIAEQETVHLTAGSATTTASENVKNDYEKYKYHFRVGPVNGANLAQAQIDFLEADVPGRNWDSIAVLAEDYAWTEGLWAFYQSRFPEVDIDVDMWERYPPATDDFSEIYTDVEESGADAAFISTAHTGNDALKDWRPEEREFAFGGIHVPMQSPSYYEATDGACEYAAGYASAVPTAEITEKTPGFVSKYQAQNDGDSPVYTGYFTYDAIKLFADAVESEQTLDSGDLIGPLEETSFTGTTGTIEFHGRDDPYPHDVIYGEGNVHPLYFQWQENDEGEGEQTVIWPEEHRAEGDEYEPPNWL